MNVLIVNKFSNTGGAAIAALRQYQALKKKGVNVKFLVQSGKNADIVIADNPLKEKFYFSLFALGRLYDYLHLKDKSQKFFFDSASIGFAPVGNKAFQWADVIHLHWINFGFFTLKSLEKLLRLNKPVVWTLHDMWPLTGGCFHARACKGFTSGCFPCPVLKENSRLAKKVFDRKKHIYQAENLHFIAISSWIENLIKQSPLIDKEPFYVPNTIDTDFFRPFDKKEIRKKLNLPQERFFIGFIAFNPTNPYKGGKYLIEALKIVKTKAPQLYGKINLLVIGWNKNKDFFPPDLPLNFTGYISDFELIRDYYNAMDLFVLPSLEESFSLVVQEAMSCQVPVVAFETGGIPDLIDDDTGYLAEYKNASDLADGIIKVLENPGYAAEIARNARQKIIRKFSFDKIGEKLIEVYSKILR